MPEMQFVDPSNIEAIGYVSEAQELLVRFLTSGGTYVYSDVAVAVFEELMQADSKGSYLNRRIKGNYPYRKF